ncbi:flavin reductase [Rhizobium paknamense]|uniref:Flavin reductase (DIM6/NTAB) family NADH-FMN oxidoreductase RutF/ADP-ribose pyrophosphatase YjhB (NUDIX family) n=1 Tax=Rhizobium paknamense TaxID=1206817 RepID=A0ABU0IHT5_9HYPH|nr:flavin reductase [Rhizobium paknamense]MDQ0457799.1 flavin reductase (DIM6/NTAB) family NADH-FMN oxidoreductase RutF/ADP-ribose pyrophosphatase YjhB (NUDIX family) [Rhizobium paknamense]
MTAAIDPRALRDAFGAFATGVTVVTATGPDGKPIGFTANSFTSVSLDPPLLLICLAKTSRNFAVMTEAKGFAVNILADDQREISNTFARPVEDRFASVDWRPGEQGGALLDNVAAWFDCAMEQVIEAGDHVILLGRVHAFGNSGRNGLGYARGGYFVPALEARAVSTAAEGELSLSALVERGDDVLLVEAQGKWALPGCTPEGGEPLEALKQAIETETGLSVTLGFLYSVYETADGKHQHLVYRAFAEGDTPKKGRFVKIETLPALDNIDGAPTRDILTRFANEHPLGNFSLYVGGEKAGRVHPIARKA